MFASRWVSSFSCICSRPVVVVVMGCAAVAAQQEPLGNTPMASRKRGRGSLTDWTAGPTPPGGHADAYIGLYV